MISTRPMIPMLTHVDNLGDINLDMTSQEQSLETIASNTNTISNTVENIKSNVALTGQFVDDIHQRIIENNINTDRINSSVGSISDADTATTVIGLLKSIVNKLS